MSFGQKNPWPRVGAGNQINPIFQGIAGQQFTNIPGMIPNINNLVNTAAFGGILAQQQPRANLMPRSQSPQNKKKNFIGTITKFLDSYGFIDDEVFFQTNVVTGGTPMLGARCMVEAVYNSSMPFHWNATTVQMIQENIGGQSASRRPGTGNRWDPQPNGSDSRGRIDDRVYGSHVRDTRDSRDRHSSPSRRSPLRRERRRSPIATRRSPSPIRRAEKRERSRERSRSPRRETTRDREASPPRRRARVVPRYSCKTVKPLVPRSMSCADLRTRYKNLYVPSDFISVRMDWLDSFDLENQFNIGLNPVTFHVNHKDIDIPEGKFTPEQLEAASDEDHRFCVRTLLLSHPGIAEVRKKVFGLLPDGSVDENIEVIPFNKAIQFLTGIRGRNEVMALGGTWSPSKDGENPLDLPTQINTAVRTIRELIGVDLSACPTWYKVAQLEYYRSERDRVDTITLLMPDTSSISGLMPTPEEHAANVEELKKQLSTKIAEIDAEEFVSSVEKRKNEVKAAANGTSNTTSQPNTGATSNDDTADKVESTSTTIAANETGDNMETDQTTDGIVKLHWSAPISQLRVAELRDQLSVRGLDTKGVKNILVQRLQKALDDEKNLEETNSGNVEMIKGNNSGIEHEGDDETAPDDPMDTSVQEKKDEIPDDPQNYDGDITLDQLVEKQDEEDYTPEELEEIRREREKFDVLQNEKKQSLVRHYVFPEHPAIMVYPSKTAKNGRFDCKVTSLQSLLEYRIEDSKEASFEAFLFSECVREMFDRLNAFNVYKSIQTAYDYETETQLRKEALTAALVPSEESNQNPEEKNEGNVTKTDSTTSSEKDEREILVQFKQLVSNFDLFSSFAYFDTNICGYLMDRDCEEVLLSIGLRLSRGDINRSLKRVMNKEKVNYRNFTDRWMDKNNEIKYTPGIRNDAPSLEQLLIVHPKTIDNEEGMKQVSSTPDVTAGGMVIYKGAALNIKQTLDKHQEIKDEVTKLFTQVQEQEHVLKNYKEQVETLEKKKKRLESDVAHYKKKAYDAEKCLKTNEDDVVMMKTALQDCKRFGERLIGVVERVMPVKEKTKEPSVKPETPKKENESSEVEENSKIEENEPTLEGNNDESGEQIEVSQDQNI